MAARRPRTFEMSNEHRVKIQNSNILNALIEHAEGQRDMSATQVTAGLGLLRKVLPDLSQSDITHTVKHDATDYTRAELVALLEQARRGDGRVGTDPEAGRGGEPDSVH